MLEGNTVNLRIMEKEDLPLLAKWANNLEFSGEFEPLEQTSLAELERWYSDLRSDEVWLVIEEKRRNNNRQRALFSL